MLAEHLVSSARAGFDAFLQLQRIRVSIADSPTVHYSRRSASEQSYSRLDAPLGVHRDVDTELLWALSNVVLTIIEASADATDASRAFGSWYRTYFTSVDALYEVRDHFLEHLPSMPADKFSESWQHVVLTILGSFLAGHLEATAALMSATLQMLRQRDGNAFTHEEESCFGDIIRLLTVGFRSASQFMDWQRAALRLVADARYALSPDRYDTPETSAVSQIRALALDILIMMSGDIPLILDSCNSMQVDALGFSVALCSIVNPYVPLNEVHREFKAAMLQAETPGAWFLPVVEAMLNCQSTTDMIHAMKVLSDTATTEFGETHQIDTDTTRAAEGASTEESNDAMKRFCVAYMAAHLSDICMPSILPAMPSTELLHMRNELVAAYVQHFAKHPFLWNVALGYLVFSPLLDPRLLKQQLQVVAAWCAQDAVIHRQFIQLCRNQLDAGSQLQRDMRQTLRRLGDGSRALEEWIAANDATIQYANFFLQEAVVAQRWSSGRHVEAVWEAIVHQQTGLVQRDMRRCLAQPDATYSPIVLSVGEAVQNGLLPLDACPNGSLSTILRVAAAMVDVAEEVPVEPMGQTSASSSASQLLPYRVDVAPQQRLSSTEYILQNGLELLHTATALRLIRGSLGILDNLYTGVACKATVDHLALLNLVVNTLWLRSKTTSSRTHNEVGTYGALEMLRVVVLERVARGR